MASRRGERRTSKTAGRLSAVAFTIALAYTSGILALGGCGGAPWPSHGKLPERVIDKLQECGKKGPTPMQSASYALTFTVHVREDDYEARVDDVMLTDSTLHLEEVESCMSDALYAMRTPLEALALRQYKLSPDPPVAPETRALLGQAEAALFLQAAAMIVVGYAVYTVIVHVVIDKHRTRPKPPPPPPALSATSAPTSTPVPTATTVPIVTAVPVSTSAPVDFEARCKPYFERCLEKIKQPKWNRKDFGPVKDCGACNRECKAHARGIWPNYKCPDE